MPNLYFILKNNLFFFFAAKVNCFSDIDKRNIRFFARNLQKEQISAHKNQIFPYKSVQKRIRFKKKGRKTSRCALDGKDEKDFFAMRMVGNNRLKILNRVGCGFAVF